MMLIFSSFYIYTEFRVFEGHQRCVWGQNTKTMDTGNYVYVENACFKISKSILSAYHTSKEALRV